MTLSYVDLILYHLRKFAGMGWLGHEVDLFSNIWGISTLSFAIVALVYIPTDSGLGYQHLMSLHFYVCVIAILTVLNSWFLLVFLMFSQFDMFFIFLLDTWISIFEKCRCMPLSHSWIDFVVVVVAEVLEVSAYSDDANHSPEEVNRRNQVCLHYGNNQVTAFSHQPFSVLLYHVSKFKE